MREQNPHLKPSRKLGRRTVEANVERLGEGEGQEIQVPKGGGVVVGYDHTKPIKRDDSLKIQAALEAGVLKNAKMVNVKRYSREELLAVVRGYASSGFGGIDVMETEGKEKVDVEGWIGTEGEVEKVEMMTASLPSKVRDRFLNDIL